MGENIYSRPVVQVPAWSYDETTSPEMGYSFSVSGMSPTVTNYSSFLLSALQRYLPSNEVTEVEDDDDSGVPVDVYLCDEFRMYDFKVRRCTRARSHDWTECPFAHPGEKASRRDPRRFHYSGTACPDYRKGGCRKGESCEYAHGVFECWLHPARYRTQPCKDGTACRRRVCFFAHTTEQLRILPPGSRFAGVDSYDGSPLRQNSLEAYFSKMLISSPTSTLISPPHSPPSISPPLSPLAPVRRSVNDVLTSLRQLQLSKAKSMSSTWVGGSMGSPRGSFGLSQLRPGSLSLPATPSAPARFETWDRELLEEEPMERVESGRGLRAQMYEKLSKENALDGLHGDWASALLH